MGNVKLSLPIHDGIGCDKVVEFLSAHLGNNIKPVARYYQGNCEIVLPENRAASINVLYYSLPEWAKSK